MAARTGWSRSRTWSRSSSATSRTSTILDEAPTIAPAGDDRFTADARATLDELKEATGIDLSETEIAEDVDTLGGLIVTLAGRVPAQGELIEGPEGLEFEILDADPRRDQAAAHPSPAARAAPETAAPAEPG